MRHLGRPRPLDADRLKRRAELFGPLVGGLIAAIMVIAVLSYGLLSYVADVKQAASRANEAAQKARTVANDAEKAVALALRNQNRIYEAEERTCRRIQRVRNATNRNSAIIFLVLSRVSTNVASADGYRRARAYRKLGLLPKYEPTTNCQQAIHNPDYAPGASIPFPRLAAETVRDILTR